MIQGKARLSEWLGIHTNMWNTVNYEFKEPTVYWTKS